MDKDHDHDHINTVLVVDDEASVRKTLRVLLQPEGHTVIFAENGEAALAQANKHKPDIVLLDVMMPDMNGFTVCRHLRATPSLAEVPIIMITALDDRDSRLEAIEAGADDFISKPFDRVELRARIRATLRLNRYRQLLIERALRQEAEEEIRQRERELDILKEVERLQNQFISNASHELRTPLSTITLLSSNLDDCYDTLDHGQRRKMIGRIRKQSQVLNKLIENVLEISRLDNTAQLSLADHPVDLVPLVQEEINLQLPLAQEKSQLLQVTGDQKVVVSGNTNELQRIIRNLLNNAIKYTPQAGQIIWECRTEMRPDDTGETWPGSTDLPTGRWVALRLTDTGIGIAQEHLAHLFDRFYRVQSQGSIRGTGLGLAIVRDLVQRHQGHIAVTSVPGQGTTFAFYLPQLKEAC